MQVELDEDAARKVFRLIDALEDSDDVQNVFANFDVSDEVHGELDAATPERRRARRRSARVVGAGDRGRRLRLALHPNTCSDGEDGGMRVLGVDPGLTRCGVGVVDGAPGRPLTLVARRRSCAPPADRRPRARGCSRIEQGIEAWLDEYRPDAVAVERVFSQHNVRTVMGTAQASGDRDRRAPPGAGSRSRCTRPSEVKAAVTGSGRADKAQVGAMVDPAARGSPRRPKPADAADALALAICHVWRGGAAHGCAAAPRRPPGSRARAPHPAPGRRVAWRAR